MKKILIAVSLIGMFVFGSCGNKLEETTTQDSVIIDTVNVSVVDTVVK